jgi:hypothetical protein
LEWDFVGVGGEDDYTATVEGVASMCACELGCRVVVPL